MITKGVFGLDFGGLDLMGNELGLVSQRLEPVRAGLVGEPVPVVKTVESFLMDGAIETTESFDNRGDDAEDRCSGAMPALRAYSLIQRTERRDWDV